MGASHTDLDYVRAIRHGIDHDGTALLIMPSNFFHNFSDADLGAIITYIRSVPPVDNELPGSTLGPFGRFFLLIGAPFLAANEIDHTAPRPTVPEHGVTAEYGKYLAVVCTACHGDDLASGSGEFAGPNITPAGQIGKWSEAQFITTMRSGTTPEGEDLDPEEMPWKRFAKMTDDELKAVWLYLESVPPVEPIVPK